MNNPKAILNLTLALLEVRSNLKKYQTMNIGHGQSDNNTTQVIRLNNHDISITDSLKLLGVTIDSKLNFSEHINMICKIAGQKIGVLMRLRNLIPTNAKLKSLSL